MDNILNIPSKNSYLTSKQWNEVVEYVKNRKIVTDETELVKINENIIETIESISTDDSFISEDFRQDSNVTTFNMRATTATTTTGYYTLASQNKTLTYSTLNAAMESASVTDTIYVYGEVTESTTGSAANRKLEGYDITITKDPDYSGRAYIWFTGTLSGSATAYIVIYTPTTHSGTNLSQKLTVTGELTIVAPRTEDSVSASEDEKPLINIRNNGQLILGDKSELVYGYDTVKIDDTAILTMNSGTIRKGKNSCIHITGNGIANINGGQVRGSDGSGTSTTLTTFITPYDVYMEDNGKLIMSNGKIFCATNHCVHIDGGEFEMNGGEIYPCYEATKTTIKNYGLLDTDLNEVQLLETFEVEYAEMIVDKKTAKAGVYVNGTGLFTMKDGSIYGFYGGRCVMAVGGNMFSNNIEERRPAIHFQGGTLHSTYASDGAGIKVTNNEEDISGNIESYVGAAVIMTGGNIERNVAHNGGAIRVERNTSFHMNGGYMTRNIAINHEGSSDGGSGGGGAVRLVGAEFIMNGGTIAYNKAYGKNLEQKYNGGGIGAVWQLNYGNIDTKLAIYDGNIINNWSNKNGGGISATNKKNDTGGYDANINVYIYGGTITNNLTNDCGGGVYVGGGNLIVYDGTIGDNKAEINGGAVYVDGGFVLYNGSVVSNVANDCGGAVCVINGDANIEGGIMKNNIALNNGGALMVTNGNVIIGMEECHELGETSTHIHPIVSNNIASDGGGIYIDGGSTTMWCGDINENHTHDGTVNVLVVNGQFTYNGGTIGKPYDSGVIVLGGKFEDNTTESEGKIKHELHYHSILTASWKNNEIVYNFYIPESKWITSPKGYELYIEENDNSSPTWADLFPEYEFVGWENKPETDTVEIVNLYAIWEER